MSEKGTPHVSRGAPWWVYPLVPVVAFVVSFLAYEQVATVAVADAWPAGFPLVVFDPAVGKGRDPHAVFARQLTAPSDWAPERFKWPAELNRAGSWRTAAAPACGSRRGFARYRWLGGSEEQGVIEVEASCSGDYMNIGRYRVDSTGVKGLSHRNFFGPGAMMLCGMCAFAVAAVVWPFVGPAARMCRRR